jgi:hypothetical protein
MNYENYIIEATQMVEAWELPDEALPQAIQAQAELMAGLEFYWGETNDHSGNFQTNPF